MTEQQEREVHNLIQEGCRNEIIAQAVGVSRADISRLRGSRQRGPIVMEEGFGKESAKRQGKYVKHHVPGKRRRKNANRRQRKNEGKERRWQPR